MICMKLDHRLPRLISISRARSIPVRSFIGKNAATVMSGTIGSNGVYVEQQAKSALRSAGATAEVIRNYFALDHPLAEICRSFPERSGDERGARFLPRPAHHSAAALGMSGDVHHLVDETGGAHPPDLADVAQAIWRTPARSRSAKSTPSRPRDRIAELTEQELRACALGYRAKNLLATARLVASGEADLEQWSELSDEALRARLCELPGVGAKVANCVMLFAYERLRAFPDRRLDRARLEAEIFSAKTKSDRDAAPRLLRNLFRRARRLRAAIPVSSCAKRRRRVAGRPRNEAAARKLLGQAMCDIIRPIGELSESAGQSIVEQPCDRERSH